MEDNTRQAMLNAGQAAKFLGASTQTLAAWRMTGRGPDYLKMGNRFIRYRLEDLVRWAEAHSIRAESQETTA